MVMVDHSRLVVTVVLAVAETSEACESFPQETKPIEGQPCLACLSRRDFLLEIGFELSQSPLELIDYTCQLASFPDTNDRFLQSRDSHGQFQQNESLFMKVQQLMDILMCPQATKEADRTAPSTMADP